MPLIRSFRSACVAAGLGSLLSGLPPALAADTIAGSLADNNSSQPQTGEPATDRPVQSAAANDLPEDAQLPLELQLSANALRYDGVLGRVIAEGHVQATVAGGRLLADRLEYDTRSRTVFARGSVRLQRGQQYLQASQLRFSLLEGSGEADDVYGILDLDGSDRDYLLSQPPSEPLPAAEPLSCTPILPPVPNWHPYNWAVTAWGGQMIDANFGDAFYFNGRWRPEYLAGIGVNKRILDGGPFALDLDVNLLGHNASSQAGGPYNQAVPNATVPAQSFGEGTLGLGLRIWMQPWLSIFLVEGVSMTTDVSNYERTFRKSYSQFLNYLAFEVEALINPRWSVVGRLHHRSGAYGVYSGVREGSNGYLVGVRYRFGQAKPGRPAPAMTPAQGCPGALPPESSAESTMTAALDRAAIGQSRQSGTSTPPEAVPDGATLGQGQAAGTPPGLWQQARAQEKARQEAISRIQQRVSDVQLQQSLRIERRFGFDKDETTTDTANVYGGIVPEQLKSLNTTANMKAVDGGISRWRFQARSIKLSATGWSASRVGLTNDPFTPAQSWLEAIGLQVGVNAKGDTIVSARRTRILLEDRLPIPGRLRQRIRSNQVESPVIAGFDVVDRDGVFVGYDAKPIKIGKAGLLRLQPQLMLQRTIDGVTNSYPLPGSPPGSAGVQQPVNTGDQFGLLARWNDRRWGFDSKATLDISTFNSENFANGTRSWGDISRNVKLPLLGESTARLFGAYRFRAWNGSLGEQDVYTAYGLSLEDQGKLPDWGQVQNQFYWRVGLGNFRACSNDCATTNTSGKAAIPNLAEFWRGNAIASLTSTFPLWTGTPLALTADQAFQNSPVPIVPGLKLNTNITGALAYYDDGQYQNTLAFSAGPVLTLGHFSKPFLDYTQFAVTGGVTLRAGISPLSFDRAVDLGTLNFGLTQQIAGPMLLSVGYGVNVDPASGNYGATTGSYVELRWQRRSYDIGFYYSPYEQLGGIRVRLNDFSFKGSGTPFVPYHPSQAPLKRNF
ncbi:MAG: DUF3769 domain-containing protein [Cyanobacteriota bacterium]|nr:DUF3769 domain-containing protein [Cyanobacteriota bacterium]